MLSFSFPFFFSYIASRHGAVLLSGRDPPPITIPPPHSHLSEEIWNKGDPFSTCSGFQQVRGVPIYMVPSHWHQEDFHYMPLQGGRLRMCSGHSFLRYVQNAFFKKTSHIWEASKFVSIVGINHAFIFSVLLIRVSVGMWSFLALIKQQ